MNDIDEDPLPSGILTLQTLAMPANTNANGDIFAGWLVSQMDLAGSILAHDYAEGRVTTVAIGGMAFLRPVPVGATVSCYTQALETGRSSIRTLVEVWIKTNRSSGAEKVTEGEFVYVSIDDKGKTQPLKKSLD